MKLFFAEICADKNRFDVSEADVAFYYGLGDHVCKPPREKEIIVKEQMFRKYPHVVETIKDFFQPSFMAQARQEGIHIGIENE